MKKLTLEETEKKLNEVSPSFCLAKWAQCTLHLQIGHTHSCHHPDTHKIPLEEIQKDPSALQNTSYLKNKRQQMLNGVRPKECDYCWNIEDVNQTSDRIYKSRDSWAMPTFDEYLKAGATQNTNPRYLEVSFSNVCNFKCGYCAPHISSKWMEEIKQFGAYQTSKKFNNLEDLKINEKMPIPHNQPNPYVDAFWKWWPDLVKDLLVFRITGGEPLLSKDTWKVLDYLEANPNPNLEIAINTNLGVPDQLIDQFIDKIHKLKGKIKMMKVFTSVDTTGTNAEYIRTGLDYSRFLKNAYKILDTKETVLVYMITVNALSVANIKNLFMEISAQKAKYGEEAVFIDTPYLRNPQHYSLQILTSEWVDKMEEAWEYLKSSNFYKFEVEKFKRIILWMKQPRDMTQARKDFIIFVDEQDRRRGTNFLKACPEYTDFYYFCKNL